MKKIVRHFMVLLTGIAFLFAGCNDDDDSIAVTGVKIEKATLDLLIGTSETLVATVQPENATNLNVVWSGSNDEIATVDPTTGKVTAVAAGDVVITVTTEDGGKTATCAVTVQKEDNVLNDITDPAFKAYVEEQMVTESEYYDLEIPGYVNQPAWDTDNDGKLSAAEAAMVKSISIHAGFNGVKVESLAGIEYFTGLKSLVVSLNYIEKLDLSNFESLREVQCWGCGLTELKVSGCSALSSVMCSSNDLTSLDLTSCGALTSLRCDDNSLTSLDVSGCPALEYLYCNDNQLTSLSLLNNTRLGSLECNNNKLTELDVTLVTTPYFAPICGTQALGFKLKISEMQRAYWEDYGCGMVGNDNTVDYEVVG